MMNPSIISQRGSALLVALMFLIILTLLSVHAMRTSTMELRLAGNEQERRLGFDSLQSARDAVLASDKIYVTNIDDITCYGFGMTPDCTDATATNIQLDLTAGVGEENMVRAKLDAIASCPRGSGYSYEERCAFFTLESSYDATSRRGARVGTQEGFIKFIGSGDNHF